MDHNETSSNLKYGHILVRDDNKPEVFLVIWCFVRSLWNNTEQDKPVDIILFDFQSPQMQTRKKKYLRKSEILELLNKDACACSYIFKDRCENSFAFFAYFCIYFQTSEVNFALEMFYCRGYALFLSVFVKHEYIFRIFRFSQGARMKCVSYSISWNDGAALNHSVGIRVTTGERRRGGLVREVQHRRESWRNKSKVRTKTFST